MKRLLFILTMAIACWMLPATAHGAGNLIKKTGNVTRDTIPQDYIRLDNNQDPAGLIVVVSQIDDLQFSNNVIDVDKNKDEHNGIVYYMVYVLDGTRKIDVAHSDYIHVEVDLPFPAKGGELMSGILIEGDRDDSRTAEILAETATFPVHVRYDDYAELYIDNVKQEEGADKFYLEEGEHSVEARFEGEKYNRKLKVKPGINGSNAVMSGKVVLTGVMGTADSNSFHPRGNAPIACLESHDGSTYRFGHMLGKYHLHEYANTHAWVDKDITVGQRSHNVFRLDEMVAYTLIMYHGTHLQQYGLELGYVNDFGGSISLTTDIKTSIKTPYGKIEFKDKEDKVDFASSAMSLNAGPMFKLFRKFYAQVGGGCVRYLSTDEKMMLTADYRYKWGGSACASIFYRARNLIFGLGYTRQFVKGAYNPGLKNQINFSFGWAKGQD